MVRNYSALGYDGANPVSVTNPQDGSPYIEWSYEDDSSDDPIPLQIIKTESASTSGTSGDLDRYATTAIRNGSYTVTDASGKIPLRDFYKMDSRSSPEIDGLIPLQAGDYCTVTFRGTNYTLKILEYTIDYNTAMVTVKFGSYDLSLASIMSKTTSTLNRIVS